MSEILKKWDAICNEATIKFNTNDTVVFNYAVVKIVGRGNDPIEWQQALNAGGSITRHDDNYYIEYQEIRSETQYVADGKGRISFGKDQPAELIVGAKAIILFINYPQSENRNSIHPFGVLHLKSKKYFLAGDSGLLEYFYKSHNLNGNEKVNGGGSKIKPIKISKKKTGGRFAFAVISMISFYIFGKLGVEFLTLLSMAMFVVFLVLSVLALIGKVSDSGNDTLKWHLPEVCMSVLELLANDAPTLWQELESNS